VRNKEQAAQIFAFQNDRGKGLTKLEKLKAFLMHQVYIHSPSRIEAQSIEDVDEKFAEIYRLVEEIESLNEDEVLAHHLTAFLAQTSDAVDLMKRRLRPHATGALKVEWMRRFCAELRNSFRNVKQIETLRKGGAPHEQSIGDVLLLQAWATWPLLLKLMHHHHNELPRLEEALRLMEITVLKLQFMSGKWANALPGYATGYDGEVDALVEWLRNVSQHGFKQDWDFNGGLKGFLTGDWHYDVKTRYLLWKYENHLRKVRKVGRLSLVEYQSDVPGHSLDASIEHILPVNPESVTHSEIFKQKYLHNLGNLVLMTRGGNSSLSNALPIAKVEGLKATTYLTQREVAETIENRGRWGEAEILERKEKIVQFALQYWRVAN
jgi:hypothetical protein